MIKRKLTAVGILFCLFSSSLVFAQTSRGVRVKDSNGQTKEVKLYDGSYALVIGESDYTNGWDPLAGVKADVTEVSRILEKDGFTVESELNLTSEAFKNRIERFISDYGYQPNNRLLIYYAGHGHTLKSSGDGRELGYVVPVDTPDPVKDETGFRRKAISMDTVQNYAKEIQAKHAIFIFDSCFSGKLVSRERVAVPPIIEESVAFPVRQFITAGAANQPVPDESIFRRTFVRGLEGEADRNNDGYVTGTELADFLKEKVTNYSNRAQTPQYGKINDVELDKGDFVFVSLKNQTVLVNNTTAQNETPVVAKDRTAVEREAWDLVKNSNDPQDFRSFLTDFPNGANAGNAKIKLEQSVWESVRSSGDAGKVKGYLDEFSIGANASSGRILYGQLTRPKIQPTPSTTPTNPNLTSGSITAGTVITNSLGMKFAYSPAGTFQMGSTNGDADEKPVRTVRISQGFYMGRTEVTQGQWEQVMGTTIKQQRDKAVGSPLYDGASLNGVGADYPMYYVSWEESKEYIRRLNARNDGYIYSLPTEAEWEYAARAGTTGDYAGSLKAMGWYHKNSENETHPVATKQPNAWGLYDMHGNVWESCEDIYKASYTNLPTDGTANISIGNASRRVLRGGSVYSDAKITRSAIRVPFERSKQQSDHGFRVLARLK